MATGYQADGRYNKVFKASRGQDRRRASVVRISRVKHRNQTEITGTGIWGKAADPTAMH